MAASRKPKPPEAPSLFGEMPMAPAAPTARLVPRPSQPEAPFELAPRPAPAPAAQQAPAPPIPDVASGPQVEIWLPSVKRPAGQAVGQAFVVKPARLLVLGEGGELLEEEAWPFQPGTGRIALLTEVLHLLKAALAVADRVATEGTPRITISVPDADLNGFLVVHLATWHRMGLLQPGASLEEMALPFPEPDRDTLRELAELVATRGLIFKWAPVIPEATGKAFAA